MSLKFTAAGLLDLEAGKGPGETGRQLSGFHPQWEVTPSVLDSNRQLGCSVGWSLQDLDRWGAHLPLEGADQLESDRKSGRSVPGCSLHSGLVRSII